MIACLLHVLMSRLGWQMLVTKQKMWYTAGPAADLVISNIATMT